MFNSTRYRRQFNDQFVVDFWFFAVSIGIGAVVVSKSANS